MRLRTMACLAFATLPLAACNTARNETSPEVRLNDPRLPQSARLSRLAADVESHGDRDTAVALYEQAATAPGATPAADVQLGDVYARAGSYSNAVSAYRRALAKSPEDGKALVGLGSVMMVLGDNDAGLRALEQGTRIINTSSAYNRLGVAQTVAGQTAAAEASFTKGLDMAPHDLDIKINLGLAAALGGDGEKALPLIQQVAASPAAQTHHKRNVVVCYGLIGRDSQVLASPPVGLSGGEVKTLLARARSIRAKATPKARAEALGLMNTAGSG